MIQKSAFNCIVEKAKQLYDGTKKPWFIEELNKEGFLFNALSQLDRDFIFPIIMFILEQNIEDTDKIYNEMLSLKDSSIAKIIGSGYQGIVFNLGDKVLKYFPQGFRKNDITFYTYCRNNSVKCFPKVYRIGKNYVVIEKLKQNLNYKLTAKDYIILLKELNKCTDRQCLDIRIENIGFRNNQLVLFDI